MSNFCAVVITAILILIPIAFFASVVIITIRAALKKRVLPIIIGCIIGFPLLVGSIIPLSIIGAMSDPMTWCEHEREVTIDTDSTCSKQGKTVEYCRICDGERTTYKNKLDHDYKLSSTLRPTCTDKGKIVVKCTMCEKEIVEYKDKIPHKWEIESIIEPTCTKKGTVVEKCTMCGNTQTESKNTISHKWELDFVVEPTCTKKGTTWERCVVCTETRQTSNEDALGHSMSEYSRTEPTHTSEGKIVYRCERCDLEEQEIINQLPPLGGEDNPYVLTADEWYKENYLGTTSVKYIDKWVKVSGTVLSISDYTGLKGYYLVGGKGQGLVCWVYSNNIEADYGQYVEYIGRVSVEDMGNIEITDGKIVSAIYPSSKPKSPVTISEWKWTRDYVGGVEWTFKLTNNTDKTIKYVAIEWDCYNAVGDLVYDEITGKSSYGIRYTGPLEGGKTSNSLCNTSLFYSYSYKSSRLCYLSVEFMDGTIIQITDRGYTDILK